MKTFFIVVVALMLTACGYSGVDSQVIGQVKKVRHETPLFCSDNDYVDVSLGVMRNGVGSMSTQDMLLQIKSPEQKASLQQAVLTGKLVNITYDSKRWSWCYYTNEIKTITVLVD